MSRLLLKITYKYIFSEFVHGKRCYFLGELPARFNEQKWLTDLKNYCIPFTLFINQIAISLH